MNKDFLIVFDIDGTLTQTAEMHQAAFNRSLAKIGVEKHEFDLNAFPHHTDSFISKEIYERSVGKAFSPELKKRFEELLWEDIKQQSIEEVKGATNFVKKLHSENITPCCFATGALRRTALFKLKEVGIPFHEDLVVASDEHHSREAIINNAIANAQMHYGVDSFQQIISIGDGIWDLIAAKKLGLTFIGIGQKNKVVMQAAGMKYHFNDFSDVDAILKVIYES